MKNIKHLLFILFAFFVNLVNAQDYIDTDLCNQVFESDINVPILEFVTIGGVEPTGESLKAPEGCVGVALINNEYVQGRLRVILQGDTLYDSGDYVASKSGMRLKLRGNTSAGGAKKPYKIKLSKKADLLFRDGSDYKDKEWVLLRNTGDFIIKFITTSCLAEMLGFEWIPQCKYVNVVLNGDFKGDYLLVENVKKGKARVDIEDDGFIIEDDAYWWETNTYFKGEMLPYSVGYTFKYPDPDDVNEEIITSARDCILNFEKTLKNGGDIGEYIDVENFAAWLLAQDILGQYDSFGTNRFLYRKNENSVMKIGPLWDCDGAFRKVNDWSDIHVPYGYSFYFQELLDREDFFDLYLSLWRDIRPTLKECMYLKYDSIGDYLAKDFNKSIEFDSKRWKNTVVKYETCVDKAVAWFEDRVLWLDEQLMKYTNVDVSVVEDGIVDVYTIDGRTICYRMQLDELGLLPKGFYIIKERNTGQNKKIVIK